MYIEPKEIIGELVIYRIHSSEFSVLSQGSDVSFIKEGVSYEIEDDLV